MRRRLLLGYLGLTFVILVAFGVPLGIVWTGKVRADDLAALASTATELAKGVATPLSDGLAKASTAPDSERAPDGDDGSGRDTDAAVDAASTLPASTRTALAGQLAPYGGASREVVALLDRGGAPFVATGPLRGAAGSLLGSPVLARAIAGGTVTGTATLRGEPLLYAAAPVVATAAHAADEHAANVPVTGVVVVADSASVATQGIRNIVLGILATGAVALGVAALAGYGLVRSLMRPLLRIQGAVARIGSGELDARAPAEGAPHELAALAGTVNTMALRLGELISAQRAFVADASHQLRTPLTALRLRLENLSDGSPIGAADSAGILAEVDRLSRIVSGLLALARAEERPPDPEPTDVTALVAARTVAWQPVADELGVVLIAAPGEPATALAIPGDLEQALDNLVDNALRHTRRGGTVRLSVTRDGADGAVSVHVADSGPGMSAEDRAHAFDRFWSGRAETNAGSGLGLAIVDRLVRNMGGRVELADAPARGLDAVVHLRTAR